MQPKSIGHYRVEHEVGSGGLGKVYRAVDSETGKVVAVKVLHEKYQKSKRFLGIFHRELLIISRLKHKHVIEYVGANYKPPLCYIVTEFIDGWSLYKLGKQVGRFPPLVALAITIDILQGIDYLHLHDLVHSDLSSPNVMISRTGRVLVTDFGLACNGEFENYQNYMVGTPGYYSPEHITDAGIEARSDIYCVGLLLYEMLTGHKAVRASKNRDEVLESMRNIDFDRINCEERKLEALIRSFLKKSLQFKLNKRHKNTERAIYDIYKIMKKFEIRYARYAIQQFLAEKGLASPLSEKYHQDIHRGENIHL